MNPWGIPERTYGCQQTPIFQGNTTSMVSGAFFIFQTHVGATRLRPVDDFPWKIVMLHDAP